MTDIIVKDIKNGSEYYYGGSAEVSAEDVSYDNTESGMTADNVQEAIDELAQGGGGTTYTAGNNIDITNDVISADTNEFVTRAEYDALPASKLTNDKTYFIKTSVPGGREAEVITYDNTTSGLTATNVQDAIDEVSSKAIQVNPTGEAPTTTGNNTKTLQSDGVYRLTAYHTTSGTRRMVYIKLNGSIIASKNRAPDDSGGYCSCILFDGKVGDVISIRVDDSEDPVAGRLNVNKMSRVYVQYN